MLELSLFQDSEETIYSAEKNDTCYESLADFQWEAKKMKNTKTMYRKQKWLFFSSNNCQAVRQKAISQLNKSGKNAFSAVKCPFVGQP